MMNHQLRQIGCQTSVKGKDFGSGIQDFNFQVGGSTVWNPSKSFFAITMKLQTVVGGVLTAPTEAQQIALADNACACLYDNISVKGGGQDISSLVSYCPQASQLRQRVTKSGAWLNSQGKDVWGMDSSFKARVAKVSNVDTPITELERVNVGTPGNEFSRTLSLAAASEIVTGVSTDFDGSLEFAANVVNNPNATIVPKVVVGDILIFPTVDAGYTKHVVTAVTGPTLLNITPTPAADAAANAEAYIARNMFTDTHKNTQTILWKPPVGVFDTEKLGAGDYRVSLNPNSRYKQASVECVANRTVAIDGALIANAFDLEIIDVKLYISLSTDDVKLSGVEQLFLNEQQLQSKPITGTENSMDFTVPPSTKMLAFFVQSGTTGSDIRFPSTKFKSVNGYETSLESFQLTYANTSRPSTRWASDFTSSNGVDGGVNTMTQRFHDTYSECGMSELQGGTETYNDWLKRGPIFVYRFDTDSTDRSTQVQLNIKFKSFISNTNVILCAFYSRTVEIGYENGMITEVRSLSV